MAAGSVERSGVVINDALIMIDYANRRRPAASTFAAIGEAGRRRFRPIIATTVTSFDDLMPIIPEPSRRGRNSFR